MIYVSFEGNYVLILVFGVMAWIFHESGMGDAARHCLAFMVGIGAFWLILGVTKGILYVTKNK